MYRQVLTIPLPILNTLSRPQEPTRGQYLSIMYRQVQFCTLYTTVLVLNTLSYLRNLLRVSVTFLNFFRILKKEAVMKKREAT